MTTTYKTTDIAIAATLKCLGHTLIDIEMEGNRGTFVFHDIPNATLEDFNFSNLRVEPNQFHSFIKQLSSIIRRKANS